MKKLILALLFLSISPSLFAADKLSESGFNIGVNAGAVFGKSSFNLTDWEGGDEGKYSQKDTAESIGFQVGYKHYLENGIMLGLEGDYQKSNYKVNLVDTPYSEAAIGQKVNDIFTLRAKLGKMVGDHTLAYLTGGYAHTIGDVKLRDGDYHTDGDTDASVASNGWVAGLGLEHSITEHISVRGEYLYMSTRGKAITSTNQDNYDLGDYEEYNAKVRFKTNILKVGLNYNF